MKASDRLNEFLSKIDDYIELKQIGTPKLNDDIVGCEDLNVDDLNRMTRDECFDTAYRMYQYIDYVSNERSNQENVLRWCNLSINLIVAKELDPSIIAKHDLKIASVLLDNELAFKITEWRDHAESRLTKLVNRENNLRRMAEILIEKAKRK